MAVEGLRALIYSRMRDLRPRDREEIVAELVPLLVQTLEAHGPLSRDGLRYYVNQDHDLGIQADDIHYTMYYRQAENAIEVRQLNRPGTYLPYYLTVAQAARDEQPRIPLVENYEDAYFRLQAFIERARQDHSLLDAPPEFLRALGLPLVP